jgi:hypothetical protein
MADTDTHVITRQANALKALVEAALPELKGVWIDRSPEEPLQEYEIPSLVLFTGRDVTAPPNGSNARHMSGVVVRLSRFYLCLTERAGSGGAERLLSMAVKLERAVFRQGEMLGGLVEKIEHVASETINVLEGNMETSQRFIELSTRALGLEGEPGYGTADVHSALNP